MSELASTPQTLPTQIRLVGGPPMWDGTTLTPQAADIDDLYAILQVTDGTQLPERSEDEDFNPRAVYGPIPVSIHPDDLAEWYFRGWWPHSPTDPSPLRYLVAHLVHKAIQTNSAADEDRGWLDRNHGLMLDLTVQATQAGDWEAALLLSESLHTYLAQGKDLALAVRNAEQAVAAARAWGHTLVLFEQLTELASAHRRYGDHEQAVAASQEALDLDDLTTNQRAHARYTLAMNLAWGGWHARALERYERLHARFGDLDEGLQGAVVNGLAWSLGELGEFEKALPHAQQAVTLARDGGDERTLAAALDTLGQVQSAAGNVGQAREAYQEALELYRSIDYQVRIGQVLDALKRLEEQG